MNPLPTREERDFLLTVVYGHDPRPARCDVHGDPKATGCPVCTTYRVWRQRMYRRFHERKIRLVFDDYVYSDEEPPRCPYGHVDTAANRRACEHCKTYRNWREREYRRMRLAGTDRIFTDWDVLLAHLHRLTDAGMIAVDIARASHCSETAVRRLLRDTQDREHVRASAARRLLAVPVPQQPVRKADATGTRRRIQALGRAGHSMATIGRRLGWAGKTVRTWTVQDTVPASAATAVAELFPDLLARTGRDPSVAAIAASKGWVEARYFSATNIDDPAYDPFAVINSPTAVRRQLRALAWMGQGPEQVAQFIGESPEHVAVWLKGGPALAYVVHLVDAAFEALSGTFGPDVEAADRARHEGWAPPLAWYDIDMANEKAKPCIDLPSKARKTDYPLESQVLLALIGRVKAAELFKVEKIRVVWILHRAGWSDRRIAAWLRWHPDLDLGRGAVGAFRYREGIVGFGLDDEGLSNRECEDGLVVAPSAA